MVSIPSYFKLLLSKALSLKSVEEYAFKINKGLYNGKKFDINEKIKIYFENNNLF